MQIIYILLYIDVKYSQDAIKCHDETLTFYSTPTAIRLSHFGKQSNYRWQIQKTLIERSGHLKWRMRCYKEELWEDSCQADWGVRYP